MLSWTSTHTAMGLWQGCVLGSIAVALQSSRVGFVGYDRVWIGRSYRRDPQSGDRGMVVFVGDEVVAGFFNHESIRSPYRRNRIPFDYQDLLAGMPDDLSDTFRTVIAPYLVFPRGSGITGVTSIFWSENGTIGAAEPWPGVLDHGADLLDAELAWFDDAISRLQAFHDLVPGHVAVLRSLFERRISTPKDEPILLEPWERELVLTAPLEPGQTPWDWEQQHGTRNLDAMRSALSAINVIIP